MTMMKFYNLSIPLSYKANPDKIVSKFRTNSPEYIEEKRKELLVYGAQI